jgi:D-alanyl-D-alanine dipeptidase
MTSNILRLLLSIWAVYLLGNGYVQAQVSPDSAQIPKGMVYLSEIAPDIGQDMRYAGSNNFTGKPVLGYEAAECILGSKTANALSKVNAELHKYGFGLLVLDCYRPSQAVNSFVSWAGESAEFDKRYYPHVRRSQLIAKGYIGAKSSHSSGASVDITLTRTSTAGHPTAVDMGTGFDYFDTLSHTKNKKINVPARKHRMQLLAVMKKYGFSNYYREWWHFTYSNDPMVHRRFNFAIKAKR